MTLTQITYFHYVCQYKNVTKAAEALFVSQPTISVAIRELESEFNVRLFYKNNKQLLLSPEGECFYRDTLEILKQVNKTVADMNDISSVHPILRIGVTPILSIFFFDNYFRPFTAKYPNTRLQIFEHPISSVYKHLENNSLDIVMTFLDDEYNKKVIRTMPLLHSRLCYCVCREHHLAEAPSVSVPVLKDEAVALIRSSYHVGGKIQTLFRENGIEPHVILTAGQYHIIRNYILQGLAGGFFPEALVRSDPEIVAIPIEPKVDLTIGLAWSDSSVSNGMINTFQHFLRNQTALLFSNES